MSRLRDGWDVDVEGVRTRKFAGRRRSLGGLDQGGLEDGAGAWTSRRA